jgi:hypothetical protein
VSTKKVAVVLVEDSLGTVGNLWFENVCGMSSTMRPQPFVVKPRDEDLGLPSWQGRTTVVGDSLVALI